MTPSEYRKKLKTFLTHNPWSKVEKLQEDEEADSAPAIVEPWGDDSIALTLSRLDEKALKRLNGITLLPSFSGIFHRKREAIEFIYTPYRQAELDGRKFTFDFEGCSYTCKFSKPSDVLFDLAIASNPQGQSTGTDYRNLRNFRRYLSLREKHKDEPPFQKHFKPLSFWIENCECSDQDLVRLAQHVNFYMTYFDRETPEIKIHEARVEAEKLPTRERYLWDEFPEEIKAKALDPYLIAQLTSVREASDVYRRFIYFYQVLEYASFYYLSDKSVRKVEAILKSPETPCFPRGAWQRIQDILTDEKMQNDAKIVAVVNDCVDPAIVWREIEPLRKFFEEEIQFDGGYVVKPCIAASTDLDGFKTSGLDKLVTTLRNIRNALVHARDHRMSNVITPTRQNHRKLMPFTRPLGCIAQALVISVDTEPGR